MAAPNCCRVLAAVLLVLSSVLTASDHQQESSVAHGEEATPQSFGRFQYIQPRSEAQTSFSQKKVNDGHPVTSRKTGQQPISDSNIRATLAGQQPISDDNIRATLAGQQPISDDSIRATLTGQHPISDDSIRATLAGQYSQVNKWKTVSSPSGGSDILYYKDESKSDNRRQNDSPDMVHLNQMDDSRSLFGAAGERREVADIPRCQCLNGTANCSFRNLTSVPRDCDPKTVIHFDLHNNSISRLTNFTFISYTYLQCLDLSGNNISVLEEDAFVGLTQLIYLNLSGNLMIMSRTPFPENIFSPLVNLEELKINNTADCNKSEGIHYPDRALSRLKNLRSLYMDGLRDKDFSPGFQNLTRLVSLSVAGYLSGCCHINSLRNQTFQYLTQLRYLNLQSCYILGKNIEAGSFSTLQNLVSLDLTHNEDIDIQNLDKVFYGLSQISTLRELSMQLIVNRYSLGICLDSSYIKNFPQNLEYFNAQENSLEAVDRNVTKLLSPSLKTLDLSGNRFVFGTYLKDLHFMQNLTTLKLNGGGFTYSLPGRYPFQLSRYRTESQCTLYGEGSDDVLDYGDKLNLQSDSHFSLTLPPNLKHLDMNKAGLTYKLSELTIDSNNKLQYLSMRGNNFPELNGPFYGFHSLKFLDLSSSYVKEISDKFFLHLTTLQKLNLGSNLLGDFFFTSENPQVFSALTNLKLLNLSFNAIRSLSENVFTGLDNLQELYLHRNSLADFNVNISHMHSLVIIDLKLNRIVKLPEFIRGHINYLLAKHLHVQLDLSECPISCSCENLDFLSWMTQSKAFNFSATDSYQCVYADYSYKKVLDGYNSTMALLLRRCGSNTVLFVCVSGAMFLFVCVIICSVLYRFRWKLRYLYYAAHLIYRSSGASGKKTKFEYDAFISYDHKDEDFVVDDMSVELERRGLKLCIHGRDFRAGEYIASNIVRAVCQSRRTVVVLTKGLLDSYWCKYEIQMANMESVHTGRQVLIFLLKDDVPETALGVELLYHIRNNTYIPYPNPSPDPISICRLWDKMAIDIQD